MKPLFLLAVLATSTCVQPAFAHATLGGKTASIGRGFTASFEIPHGCAGQPTTEVIVQVPPGFMAVTPVAVDGWKATSKTGPYPSHTCSMANRSARA